MSQTFSGATSRLNGSGALSLTTSTSTTALLTYKDFASGSILIPSGSAITTLTYNVCATDNGTFVPMQDGAGAAVTTTVAASSAYPIPVALNGAAFIKITVNSAGVVNYTVKG